MRRLLPVIALLGLPAPAAQARVDPAHSHRPAVDPRHQRVVEFAERQVGVPYRWGGISRRTGFDCSASSTPRTARSAGRFRTRPGAR